MGPILLVGGEELVAVNTERRSGTVALAEGSALTIFFPLADFLALGAGEHLLAI